MPPGRTRKPLSLLKQEKKSHLSKAEIEARKNSEVKYGAKLDLNPPPYVKNDIAAYAKWQEILKNYEDVDFISSSDAGFLARYCKTYSEYLDLLEHRRRIEAINFSSKETKQLLDAIDEHNEQVDLDGVGEREIKKLFTKINYIISIDGLLSMDIAINKKLDILLKMEDRSFLNPLAKIKGIPVKEKPKQKTVLQKKGFGNV